MADEKLSEEERAELEALRAEKAAREKEAKAAQERAELEALRREQEQAEREAAELAHEQEVIERNRKLMEPDEDLRMPLAQKIVLAALALIVIVAIIYVWMGV